MAKKKKRKKQEEKLHDQHHQSIHEYITRQINAEDQPPRIHVMPISQPWHITMPWCFCVPVLSDEHPMNGGQVWTHRYLVH